MQCQDVSFTLLKNAPKQQIVNISNNLSRICGLCDDEMNDGRMWQIMCKYGVQKLYLEYLSPFSCNR